MRFNEILKVYGIEILWGLSDDQALVTPEFI
jgi:hypothetical protein